jgi:hypothetical protein
MAGAHIPSVKFNACICDWAGPSGRISVYYEVLLLASTCNQYDVIIYDPSTSIRGIRKAGSSHEINKLEKSLTESNFWNED